MRRYILCFVAISLCAASSLGQARRNRTGAPQKSVPISGRALGNYNGSKSDLIPPKVGTFELIEKIPSPEGIFAAYTNPYSKAVMFTVRAFPSIDGLEKQLERIRQSINRDRCKSSTPTPNVKGSIIVGERFTLSCEGFSELVIFWSSGSVLFTLRGMTNTKPHLGLRPASLNEVLEFENKLFY